MNNDLLFFDIECYPFDSFVCIKDSQAIIHLFTNKDNFSGLNELITGKTLVGFNNHYYDDHILDAMLHGWSQSQIKDLNDRIIVGKQKQKPKHHLKTLDCFQQIDVGMPSLKKIEGNLGRRIMESSVSFNIDRLLTDEEHAEAVAYCTYDVDNTMEIYKMRESSYFEPKKSLVQMVGDKGLRWNTTTLSANVILGESVLQKWATIRLNGDDRDDMSMLDLVPSEVVRLWESGDDKGKVVVDEFDCLIEFGFGGLHGVHKKVKRAKNLKLLDVASMYPNIILEINALGTFTEKYKRILEERLAAKAAGNKTLSEALKLILNSVYGNLKSEYSSLNNPRAALSVCIYGQIALYTLCKRLSEAGHVIININTDGVGFIPRDGIGYTDIWKQWEVDFKLTLEEDSFDTFISKDVNNYIAVKDGKVKCKGADVGRYNADSPFRNNSARVCDIAIVDHLLYGKSIIDTLVENLDSPHLFQYIIQAGHTYEGTFDGDGNQYQKVNRIFPAKKGDLCLYKKRADGGLVRFPDLPNSMVVFNDDCSKIERFEKLVCLNHYKTVIEKKLDRWM